MQVRDDACTYDSPHQLRLHRPVARERSKLLAALRKQGRGDISGFGQVDDPIAAKLADRIGHCGLHPIVWQDADTGRIIVAHGRCKSRVCPTCGRIRSREFAERLTALCEKLDSPRFLTLTLKSTDQTLRDQIERLRECFTRLRRRKAWKQHVTGGVATIEVTYNAKSRQWHPHIHAIVDGTYWHQPVIAEQWEKVTGDSRIVDIRAVHSRSQVARYIVKYVTKTQTVPDLPFVRIAEWATAVHGLRLASTFGKLHGIKAEKPVKDEHGELESVIHLGLVAEHAASGDRRARRLYNLVTTLSQRGIPDGDESRTEHVATMHRRVARRLRAWRDRLTEPDRDTTPRQPARSPPLDRLGDRSKWLWQESNDPHSAILHGR